MDFKKILGFTKLVNHVCNECFQSVNGLENEKNDKYDRILDNFNNWTKEGYLESPNERLRRFRISEKGIRELIEITILYLEAQKKIIRRIPEKELKELMCVLKDFIDCYRANLTIRRYQNNQGTHQRH